MRARVAVFESASRLTSPRPPVVASSDQTAGAIVFVPWCRRIPREHEHVLRAHVVDVLADVPAVDEHEHPVVTIGIVGEPQPDRDVLVVGEAGERRAVAVEARRIGARTRRAGGRKRAVPQLGHSP
jgi:hypothetical protein